MARPDTSQPDPEKTLIGRKTNVDSKFFPAGRAGAIVWRAAKP
jgi:hypothetical protein